MQDHYDQEQRGHDGDQRRSRPALPDGWRLPGGARTGFLIAAVIPGLVSHGSVLSAGISQALAQ